jgi:hypothetical protein
MSIQPATIHPSLTEIYRAAAWWAGEGSVVVGKNRGLHVSAAQKEEAVVRWFLERFGGVVHYREKHGRPIFYWSIYGGRASGFLMTIYSCIPESPRRQGMILAALRATNERFKRGPKPGPMCRNGHVRAIGTKCKVCALEQQRAYRKIPENREKHRIQENARYHAGRA